MASRFPIPLPPRTPTPPSDEPSPTSGLRLNGSHDHPPSIRTHYDYDIHTGLTDSPEKGPDSGRTAETSTTDTTAATMLSPISASFPSNAGFYTPITPQTGGSNNSDGTFQLFTSSAPASSDAEALRNPFNFTPEQYDTKTRINSLSIASSEAIGRRKGHKYRHSSIHVSHMDSIFQPPVPRTPLTVPASLPMPTRKEYWAGMTSNQSWRLAWCFCHFLIAGYVQFAGAGSLAMTALSRLLLFDAAGATVCVAVDVMSNFEVWKRSSIKHPFGLERADVLAGFGLAVLIGFMGLDVISHGIQHSLENLGHHESHSPHSHARVASGSVTIASLLAILSTLISAMLLKNHVRIGRAMRFEGLASVGGKVLGNPSHVLTLASSACLLVLPFLTLDQYKFFDPISSFLIAALMITLGVRLGTSLASMLLMSYRPSGKQDKRAVREIMNDLGTDSGISAVEEARFWQVHYGLCIANLKLRYRAGGYGDDMARIRQRVISLIRQRLGEVRGVSWEISVQMGREKD